MKKLIIIFSLIGIGISSFGQVVEKWVDTDSLNAEKIVLNGKELDNDSIDFAIRSDSSGFADTSNLALNLSGVDIRTENDTVYLSPSGNDLTGDGSELNPYQTISRGLQDFGTEYQEADMLIYFAAGSYNLTDQDRATLKGIRLRNAKLYLTADSLTLVNSGFSVSKVTGQALKYNVTAIGQTWTENQYRDMYATDGSGTYWPIVYNSAGTDNMIIDYQHHNKTGVDEIREINVTIVNSDDAVDFIDFVFENPLNGGIEAEGIEFQSDEEINLTNTNISNLFSACTFEMGNSFYEIFTHGYEFDECIFLNNNATYTIFNDAEQKGGLNVWNRFYVRNEGAGVAIQNQRCEAFYYDAALEATHGIRCTEGTYYARRVTKFMGCTNAVYNTFSGGNVIGNEGSTIMLYGVTNMFNVTSKTRAVISFDILYDDGSANVFPIGDNDPFVIPEKKFTIDIPDIDLTLGFKDSKIDTIYPDTIPNKAYVDSYFSGSLTDGAPTASEINLITGLTPSTAGYNRQLLIFDTDGTGLFYKILSNGTSWIYFPGQTGSTAL